MILMPSFQTVSSDFEYNIDLENINVKIRTTFNNRTESWIADFFTEHYSLYGIRLVENFPLLLRHKATFKEVKGDFLILQINNEVDPETFNYTNLNKIWGLYYLTNDELLTWADTNNIRI